MFVVHRRAEQEGVVVDDGDLRAQRVRVDRAHVGAVDEHAPRGRVVEARDELHERRLARPGRADQRERRARLDGERDVAQRGLGMAVGILVVGERDVAQLDAAGAGRQRAGARRGAVIRGSRSRISNSRAPDAVARWASPSVQPSVRTGASSISR